MKRFLAVTLACGLSALLLTGCNPVVGYNVTQYSGNDVVTSVRAQSYSKDCNRLSLSIAGERARTLVAGSFTVEPINQSPSTKSGTLNYKLSLYGSEKVLRTWDVESFSTLNCAGIQIYEPTKSGAVVVYGTYVLERQNRVAGGTLNARYLVKLFDSAHHQVGEWRAVDYSSVGSRLRIQPVGGKLGDIVIGGTYVVTPLQ